MLSGSAASSQAKIRASAITVSYSFRLYARTLSICTVASKLLSAATQFRVK